MSRFSKKFFSFFGWLAVHPNAGTPQQTPYEKRILRGQTKGKALSEGRGHAKEMFRCVIGASIKINKKPHPKYYSISLFAYSNKPFTQHDLNELRDIIESETVRHFYPERSYKAIDYWGSEPEISERHSFNETVEFDDDFLNRWYFKVNGSHETEGNL